MKFSLFQLFSLLYFYDFGTFRLSHNITQLLCVIIVVRAFVLKPLMRESGLKKKKTIIQHIHAAGGMRVILSLCVFKNKLKIDVNSCFFSPDFEQAPEETSMRVQTILVLIDRGLISLFTRHNIRLFV